MTAAPAPSPAEQTVIARFDIFAPERQALALLDELDALRAAATPGPWDAEICEGELTVSAGSARTQWTEHDGFRTGISPSSYRSTDRIYEQDLDDWDGRKTKDDQQREADADLIVAAVNAVPKLTAAIRAALAYADEQKVSHLRHVITAALAGEADA